MNDRRNYPPRRPQEDDTSYKWLKDNVSAILSLKTFEKLDVLLNHINSFVEHQCKNLSASQLRNIFSKIRAKRVASEIQLNRPKLAYAAARQTSQDARDVIDFFEKIAAKVKSDEQAVNFVAFLEAIVAYHKFHHGKK